MMRPARTHSQPTTTFASTHARSVLCLPLLKQTRLVGVLYLENNLTPHAFTPARMAVLKLLASEAATSLENTRLYGDLQEREARVRRLVDSNIVGVLIWDLDGQILEANDAFLDMLQYGREDLVSGGVRWTDLTPAEWRERDERAMADLKVDGDGSAVREGVLPEGWQSRPRADGRCAV